MTTPSLAAPPPEFIRLLANDVRWGLLKTLTTSDHQVNELVSLLHQPMNLVSYHLKKMREEALITARRSEADGRDVYYSLDLARLRQLFLEAGQALHPALGFALPAFDAARLARHRVLFVCTHNSARSQMAEGLMRALGQGMIDAASAGSHPTRVHPEAIRVMKGQGIDISAQRSQSLDAVAGQSFDTIITVCDNAREVCPTFPGEGRQLHWGFPDPVAIGDNAARRAAFDRIAEQLRLRITYFLSTLPTANPENEA